MKSLIFVGLLSAGVSAQVIAAPILAVVGATKVEFFSPSRVEALPAEECGQWEAYLLRSQMAATTESTQLFSETKGAKPKKAPAAKDFKIKAEWDANWYQSQQAAELAGVMMSFQTPTGGWSKAVDYTRGPRLNGMAWTSQTDPFHYAATFDNRATTEQLNFLNAFFVATKSPSARFSVERGLDYVFKAQFPNGGWPQTFPLEGGYHDAITFNDNATTHILELLRAIAEENPKWAWLDAGRQEKARIALNHGMYCICVAQVEQKGRKTVWCAQHDPLDLKPVAARLKEPASLSGGESVGLVRFLMDNPNPPPQMVDSIQRALAWFEATKITGDDGEVKWARFYDVATNKPIFAGAQDGIVYSTFEAMAAKNHVGYDYFVTTPRDLLEKDAPRWREWLQKWLDRDDEVGAGEIQLP